MDKNNDKDIQLEIAKKARSKIISKVIGFCAAIITTILGSFSFNINKENKKVSLFEYLSACVAYHYAHDITNTSNPIYLLNNDFSLCQGQIAWSKSDKNWGGSAWIDFYADGELIYSTNPITADDECEKFEFDVHNVEKLTIIQNGTSYNRVKIIYPYFNLIK